MTKAIETAKALTFGTELEYTNISRDRAAKAIQKVVGGTVRYTGGQYDEWTVTAPDGIGGLKVVTENGWFAARPSGTENVYKIYMESFKGEDHLKKIETEAQEIVNAALKKAGV